MECKILIVDDLALNRLIIRQCLEAKLNKITFFEAGNGVKALEIMEQHSIGVVILDIIMPEKDGIGVLREMKASKRLRNIPVIMCSALEEISYVEKALSLGALDYFVKPLYTEQIEITLPLKVKNALEFYNQKMKLQQFYEQQKAELGLAEAMQKTLMIDYANHDGVEVWGRYIPCGEIGGDVYLCKTVGSKTWMLIADVSGHGIAAAMVSTMLNVLFSGAINYFGSPGVILERINAMLLDTFKETQYALVSAFVGCLEGNTLYYANAGHPYPFIDNPQMEQTKELQANGLLLGFGRKVAYPTHQCEFGNDDSVILYTDGLFDQGNPGGYADWNLIREYYTAHKKDFYFNTPKALNQLIRHFASREQKGFIDDAAVMLVRRSQ